ncbi:hypothetical protein M885DRAFT_473064, partial [Pelagophyceae sp. CCMP2097]
MKEAVKSLRKILESLARAIPGVMNAFLIMAIVICALSLRGPPPTPRRRCIYAILAVDFFRHIGRDGDMNFEWCRDGIKSARRADVGFNAAYFGDFSKSLYSMFQVLTGDSWSEAIGRPLVANFGPFGTGFFFVSFNLVNAIVLVNVVVAELLEKMVEEEPEDEHHAFFAAAAEGPPRVAPSD